MIDPTLIRHAVPARIVTARLELRRDTVADAPAVLAAVRASRAELAPWLDWVTPAYDLTEAVRGQRRAIEYWDAGDSFQWRIWRREPAPARTAPSTRGTTASPSPLAELPALLGSIDLHTIEWDDRTAELGYWLDSRCAGHGLIAEAGPEITEIGFALLGFARLTIRCHPDNRRSIATAQRLGYTTRSIEPDGVVRLTRPAPAPSARRS